MLSSSPWPYSPLSNILGLILYFLEKSELLLILAVQWAVSAVYLPQDCMQFTDEPRTHSPMSQILNLNWKIKMLLNSRRSLKMLVMPWLYERSLAEAAEAHTLMSLEKNREGSQQEEQSIGQVLAEVLPFCVRAACESRSLGSVAQEVVPGPRFHGVPGN